MPARVKQVLMNPRDLYYTLYADCDECDSWWGWRDDDRKTTNYADLKAEVNEHNKEVHSG